MVIWHLQFTWAEQLWSNTAGLGCDPTCAAETVRGLDLWSPTFFASCTIFMLDNILRIVLEGVLDKQPEITDRGG